MEGLTWGVAPGWYGAAPSALNSCNSMRMGPGNVETPAPGACAPGYFVWPGGLHPRLFCLPRGACATGYFVWPGGLHPRLFCLARGLAPPAILSGPGACTPGYFVCPGGLAPPAILSGPGACTPGYFVCRRSAARAREGLPLPSRQDAIDLLRGWMYLIHGFRRGAVHCYRNLSRLRCWRRPSLPGLPAGAAARTPGP